MPKRISRENAKDRKSSEDMIDDESATRKKKTNNRKRKLSTGSDQPPPSQPDKKQKKEKKEEVLWIDDDFSDSDSDYVPEEETVPVSVNIHFHAPFPSEEEEYESESEVEIEEGDFIQYLLNKYSNLNEEEEKKTDHKKSKANKLPIKLNSVETKYYQSLKAKKQKELFQTMERISKLGLEDGDVPYKFKVLDLAVSDYVKSSIIKKVNALSDMPSDSGESYKLKNWLDGFLRIPFGRITPLPVKLLDGRDKCTDFMTNAKNTMNSAIYGMVPAKTQVMQIIAQWIVNPNSVGNVIALHGPAGVGKTSFAKNAIAKVLNRPFEFFSLGGASDISNFVGHSYTYEGSMWGRIADCLMHAKTMNPVLYFDEVDKISNTPHGEEIISMLIHLTDRSQNNEFHDRYFSGIPLDLSQCLYVFSLNDISKVHPILRDRMQVINCSGYNDLDKKEILKGYIWPQLLERLCFDKDDIQLTDEGIRFLISEFSHEEKGVRNLIRSAESMMTRLNMLRVASSESMKEYSFYMDIQFPVVINENFIKTILTDFSKKEPDNWQHMYI